ncbi:hypothetical protein BC830DRAFT_1102513 [Chytriomyces sp. MP71]|nr:hypothetical protein BC830DRAFT_1102513 [Chytriomyces sp. MP71]
MTKMFMNVEFYHKWEDSAEAAMGMGHERLPHHVRTDYPRRFKTDLNALASSFVWANVFTTYGASLEKLIRCLPCQRCHDHSQKRRRVLNLP